MKQNLLSLFLTSLMSLSACACQGLPHGFGLGTGTIAEGLIEDAVKFWEANVRYISL